MNARHAYIVAAGTLFALSIGCGGGGWGPMGGGIEDTPDWKGNYHPPTDHNEPAKHSEPAHGSSERQHMSGPHDKPLPNTVLVTKDRRGPEWNLYQPASGYVWSNSHDRGLRTFEHTVPVVKAGK